MSTIPCLDISKTFLVLLLREQTVTVHLKLAPFVCTCAVCASVTLRRGNVSVPPEGGSNCCSIHILVLGGGY